MTPATQTRRHVRRTLEALERIRDAIEPTPILRVSGREFCPGKVIVLKEFGLTEARFRTYISKYFGGIWRQSQTGIKYSVHRAGEGRVIVHKHRLTSARWEKIRQGADPYITGSLACHGVRYT